MTIASGPSRGAGLRRDQQALLSNHCRAFATELFLLYAFGEKGFKMDPVYVLNK